MKIHSKIIDSPLKISRPRLSLLATNFINGVRLMLSHEGSSTAVVVGGGHDFGSFGGKLGGKIGGKFAGKLGGK